LTTLRPVRDDDLPAFFAHQLDRTAQHMAAFIADDAADRVAFNAHWARIRANAGIRIATIEHAGRVAGYILSFERNGLREVGYWIARSLWGRGIATEALASFLVALTDRPLYARVASDNAASMRVVQKCGFIELRRETAFANARSAEIEETIFLLA
jgi:RimJ/RimL family protein N-acetyltransferase